MSFQYERIIIVGAGAFGLSTAYHLARAGYTDITVCDKDTDVPSAYSAANDVNKILRVEYEDPFYTALTVEAFKAWKTPLFSPHFHQVGFLHCATGVCPPKAVDTLNRFRAAAERDSEIVKYVEPINSRDDIIRNVWQFQDGELPGWTGYLNRYDGYGHSTNALIAIHKACVKLGVRFRLGTDGDISSIIYDKDTGKATGVKTKSGKQFPAKLVIVAAGAAVHHLVPSLGQTVVAKSWSVAHVQLTPEEASSLKGIPVTYARDLGFFFEPEASTGLLKLCPMGGGFINTDPKTGVSKPPATMKESRFMPAEDERRCRLLLKQTLPTLANRPLINKTLCWFADTADSDFIIDYTPTDRKSVV